MSVILRPQRTSQPPVGTSLDYGSPLLSGIVDVWSAHDGWRSASGSRPATVPASAAYVGTPWGLATKLNGSSSINAVFTGGVNTGANPRTLFALGTTGATSNAYDVLASVDSTDKQALVRVQINAANTGYSAFNGISTPSGGTRALSSRVSLAHVEADFDPILYQDGRQVASVTGATGNGLQAAGLYIGGYRGQDGAWWDGSAILVAVWNRALRQDELWELNRNPWQIFAPRKIWVPVSLSTGNSYTLTADGGSFSQTGTAASLLHSRKVTADAGSLTFTGAAASLLRGRTLAVDAGTFLLGGVSATFPRGYALSAESGTFALTGSAVTSTSSYTMSAVAGEFTLTGADATFPRGVSMAADAGSYALTGEEAFFLWARVLAADSGSFSLSGGDLQTEEEQAPVKGGGGGYRRTSGWVQARKRVALQRMLAILTEEEPKPETKKLIRAIKAGKPIEVEDKKPPVVMSEISAEKIAASLIPERVAVIEQAIAGGLDVQRVILRAIEIARERDDEDVLMLL